MKTKKKTPAPSAPLKSDPPVNVAMPNTIHEKMEAITALAKAQYELAKALNSTNVAVWCIGNTIVDNKNGPAINFG